MFLESLFVKIEKKKELIPNNQNKFIVVFEIFALEKELIISFLKYT
jgi:hypothetical protein